MSINIDAIPKAPPKVEGGVLDLSRLARTVGLAVRSLWLHKLRAMLSVLGIVIGTSAVISLMAFGKGSMADALNDIKKQGTNIIVRSVKPSDDSSTSSRSFVVSYGLTFSDLERFETFGDAIGRIVPMRVFPSEVRHLERMHNARLVATTADYADVNQLIVARGRFLTEEDNNNLTNNCILGSLLADKLFPFEDPLGQSVQIRGHRFRIVGVLADRMPTGGTGGSQAAEDFNSDVYIPFRTCRARIGDTVIVRTSGSRSGEKVAISQVVLTVNADFETREGREKVKAVDPQRRTLQGRLGCHRAAGSSRRSGTATAALYEFAGVDRLDFAHCRRDRHHEHHARHGNRANPRNRDPPSSGGETPGHYHPVSGRSGGANDGGRPGRRVDRPGNCLRCAPDVASSGWLRLAGGTQLRLDRAVGRGVGAGGGTLRAVSGLASGPPRSD